MFNSVDLNGSASINLILPSHLEGERGGPRRLWINLHFAREQEWRWRRSEKSHLPPDANCIYFCTIAIARGSERNFNNTPKGTGKTCNFIYQHFHSTKRYGRARKKEQINNHTWRLAFYCWCTSAQLLLSLKPLMKPPSTWYTIPGFANCRQGGIAIIHGAHYLVQEPCYTHHFRMDGDSFVTQKSLSASFNHPIILNLCITVIARKFQFNRHFL